MKKITLKCYRSERAATLLMQAANMIAAKTKTDSLHVRTKNKSATLYVAEPLLALASAKAIKRKTGVSVIIAGLPEGTAQFVDLLERRGLLGEWYKTIIKRTDIERITMWLTIVPARDWIICAFPWPDPAKWGKAHDEWIEIVKENKL